VEQGGNHRYRSPTTPAKYYKEDPNDDHEQYQRGGGGRFTNPHRPLPPSSYINYEAEENDVRDHRDEISTDYREQQHEHDESQRRSNPLPHRERSSRRFVSHGGGGVRLEPTMSFLRDEENRTKMSRDPPAAPNTAQQETRSRSISRSGGGGDDGVLKSRRSFPVYDDDRDGIPAGGGGRNNSRLRSFSRYNHEEGVGANKQSVAGGGTSAQRHGDNCNEDVGLNRSNYLHHRGGGDCSRGLRGASAGHGAFSANDEYEGGAVGQLHPTTPSTRAKRLLERHGARSAGRPRYYS